MNRGGYRGNSGQSGASESPSRARSLGLGTPGGSSTGTADADGRSKSRGWIWQFIKDEHERAKMRKCEKLGIPYTGPGGWHPKHLLKFSFS